MKEAALDVNKLKQKILSVYLKVYFSLTRVTHTDLAGGIVKQ